MRKAINIIIQILIGLAVLAIIVLIIVLVWRDNTVDTYELTVESISITYGEEVPLDNFTVYKIMKSGKRHAVTATQEIIKYDSELIGEQTAILSYGKVEKQFLLTIVQKELDTPMLSINSGILEWTAVTNATDYLVCINGKSTQTTATQFSLVEYTPQAQTYKISVQAISSDLKFSASVLSAEKEWTRLENAGNIKVENNKLKWDNVDSAAKYILEIGKTSVTLTELEYDISTTIFDVGNNPIKIKAVPGGKDIIPSVVQFVITKLAVPTLSMKDGVLSLSTVSGAIDYETVCDSNTYTGQSKDFSSIAAGNYTATAKAKGNGSNILDSEISVPYSFSKLQGIESIGFSIVGTAFYVNIQDLPQGAKYSITIIKQMSDSSEQNVTFDNQTQKARAIGIENVKKVTVKVVIEGNGSNIINSDICTGEYVVPV